MPGLFSLERQARSVPAQHRDQPFSERAVFPLELTDARVRGDELAAQASDFRIGDPDLSVRGVESGGSLICAEAHRVFEVSDVHRHCSLLPLER